MRFLLFNRRGCARVLRPNRARRDLFNNRARRDSRSNPIGS